MRENSDNRSFKLPPIKLVPPPKKTPYPIQPNNVHRPSILNTLTDGFAFGTASSVTREGMNKIFEKKTPEIGSYVNKINCDNFIQSYNDCIFKYDNDMSCEPLLTQYELCNKTNVPVIE